VVVPSYTLRSHPIVDSPGGPSLRYQFVRGDGSVGVFLDRALPSLWQTYVASAPYKNNNVVFLALDIRLSITPISSNAAYS